MSFFAGMLADRWGAAKTLVLGQALIAAGVLAASAAPSYSVFLPLLGVAGVGYGTLNPASTTAAMSGFRHANARLSSGSSRWACHSAACSARC